MKTRLLWIFVTTTALFSCGIFHAAHAEQWQSGVAKTIITPDNSVWMAGFGTRDHLAEGTLTELWAKALVLDDGLGNRGVIVTLDLVGIGAKLSNKICDQLHSKFGFNREQIALCTSHTHSGPIVGHNLRPSFYDFLDEEQKEAVDDYADTLYVKVVDVVEQALSRLAPSRLSWGSGLATFAVNRRNNLPEEDVPMLRAEGKLKGPFDHDVPVLAVKDINGKLKTVLFGYACHCTTLGVYQWSGDYAGFAQIELEQAHRGCVAMFWAGCGGDQNPLPRRTVTLAKKYGKQLADTVSEVLSTKMPAISPNFSMTYREIDLPLAEHLPHWKIEQDANSKDKKDKYEVSYAKRLLANLNSGQPLLKTYPYPVQVWRLGDVQFVLLGGEVVVDYALRLKSELQGKKTWVAGYSNDVMAYIPSRRVLNEGGYEGGEAMIYYGLPAPWTPNVEKLIVNEVLRQTALRP